MIGKMLKFMRKERGLSQADLAQKIEVDRSTLSGYEIERRQIDFETIEKIAKICDFNIYFKDNKNGKIYNDLKRKDI